MAPLCARGHDIGATAAVALVSPAGAYTLAHETNACPAHPAGCRGADRRLRHLLQHRPSRRQPKHRRPDRVGRLAHRRGRLRPVHAPAQRERARSRRRPDRLEPQTRQCPRRPAVGRGVAGLPALAAGRLQPGRRCANRPATGTAAQLRGVHARARHRRGRSHADHRRNAPWRPAGTRHPGPGVQRPRLQGGLRGLQGQGRRLVQHREEPMSRPLRTVLVVGAAGVAAAAVAGAAAGLGGGAAGTTRGTGPVLATAPVTRATLTQEQQVNGTLGYGAPVTVTGAGGGVITWLPAPGAVIGRGQPVYKADNRPVPLFYGRLPLYRPLQAGDTGADVTEVERNLAALGYTGVTVDRYYTAATATAVWQWQHDNGLTPTGVLTPAEVVLAPGKLRAASLTPHLADPPARPGAPAAITLPDGSTVRGTIATVGAVATAGTSAADPATIAVTVTIARQAALGRLDLAPVVVKLTSARVNNVLTVPVAALVALAGGGYGVQVVTGTASHYVRVQLGMFGGGRVQVSGNGIAAGTRVGVPS